MRPACFLLAEKACRGMVLVMHAACLHFAEWTSTCRGMVLVTLVLVVGERVSVKGSETIRKRVASIDCLRLLRASERMRMANALTVCLALYSCCRVRLASKKAETTPFCDVWLASAAKELALLLLASPPWAMVGRKLARRVRIR